MPVDSWLWTGRGLTASIARSALVPASLAYRALVAARVRAYRAGILTVRRLQVPTVSVGNLTVGGTGKTPIAAWIAGYCCSKGVPAGVLLRGYGGDEGAVHRGLVPEAIVVEDPDRSRGARAAIHRGARILVLDDAYQRVDVHRDLNIALVSAESTWAAPWTLPAGPWREGVRALRRSDLVIITSKRADVAVAERTAVRARRAAGDRPIAMARLVITGFRGMFSQERVEPAAMRGMRVVAAAGVADPESLAWQCRAMGCDVMLLSWKDHHAFNERDAVQLTVAGRSADYVVVTSKDAVKLRRHWVGCGPEPLVADLEVKWESGVKAVATALDGLLSAAQRSTSST